MFFICVGLLIDRKLKYDIQRGVEVNQIIRSVGLAWQSATNEKRHRSACYWLSQCRFSSVAHRYARPTDFLPLQCYCSVNTSYNTTVPFCKLSSLTFGFFFHVAEWFCLTWYKSLCGGRIIFVHEFSLTLWA